MKHFGGVFFIPPSACHTEYLRENVHEGTQFHSAAEKAREARTSASDSVTYMENGIRDLHSDTATKGVGVQSHWGETVVCRWASMEMLHSAKPICSLPASPPAQSDLLDFPPPSGVLASVSSSHFMNTGRSHSRPPVCQSFTLKQSLEFVNLLRSPLVNHDGGRILPPSCLGRRGFQEPSQIQAVCE